MSHVRNVAITGAGSGIGRAAAELFSSRGDRVWCWDIDQAAAEETAALVRDRGGEAIARRCDVTSEEDVAAAYAQVGESYGGVDVLLANAGIEGPVMPAHQVSVEDMKRTLEVNLVGAFITAKHALPLLRRNGGGAIVMTASILSHVATPTWAAYAASKGGLLALAKSLAVEYGDEGIRVNCLAPDSVSTELLHRGMVEAGSTEEEWTEFARTISTPDQIAEVAYFLASSNAAFINGSSLLIDGGRTITY